MEGGGVGYHGSLELDLLPTAITGTTQLQIGNTPRWSVKADKEPLPGVHSSRNPTFKFFSSCVSLHNYVVLVWHSTQENVRCLLWQPVLLQKHALQLNDYLFFSFRNSKTGSDSPNQRMHVIIT